MFETSLEQTIIGTAVALWFAQGWYMKTQLRDVHRKLDRVLEAFNGLRDYLYEIDPQFDDERRTREAFLNSEHVFAGADDSALLKRKREEGKRTLTTPFHEAS